VLLVGLLLSTTTALAGDRLLGYLGVASGGLIVALGLGMLASALRRRNSAHNHEDGHSHDHDRSHDGSHNHEHGHNHEQQHDPSHEHDHNHENDHNHEQQHDPSHNHNHGSRRGSPKLAGTFVIGVAGGLVPSPSALVVLLAAVGLGRAVFGVLLVVAYGLGMAATLTAAGLLLLAVQRRVTRIGSRSARFAARLRGAAPLVTSGLVTSALVMVVGFSLAVRAASGLA
jgi:ABC-type nickel/cobalt efflux system permease component RcnA